MKLFHRLRRSRAELKRDLFWGEFCGLGFAGLISAFVLVEVLVRRGTPPAWGMSLLRVLVFYFGAGVIGGTLVGLLRPILRTWPGRIGTGILITFFVAGLEDLLDPMAASEPLWDRFTLVVELALVLGPLYTLAVVYGWRRGGLSEVEDGEGSEEDEAALWRAWLSERIRDPEARERALAEVLELRRRDSSDPEAAEDAALWRAWLREQLREGGLQESR